MLLLAALLARVPLMLTSAATLIRRTILLSLLGLLTTSRCGTSLTFDRPVGRSAIRSETVLRCGVLNWSHRWCGRSLGRHRSLSLRSLRWSRGFDFDFSFNFGFGLSLDFSSLGRPMSRSGTSMRLVPRFVRALFRAGRSLLRRCGFQWWCVYVCSAGWNVVVIACQISLTPRPVTAENGNGSAYCLMAFSPRCCSAWFSLSILDATTMYG